MNTNSRQERENYPVDAFADIKQQDKDSDNSKKFGEHGVNSYNQLLGMGQDDYSTTLPVNQSLGTNTHDSARFTNPLVSQESEHGNHMSGFNESDFTNVPGTGVPRDNTQTHHGEHHSEYHGQEHKSHKDESPKKESSHSEKQSGFAKVKDMITKHHLTKSSSKSDHESSEGETMKQNPDTIQSRRAHTGNDNFMKDNTMMHGDNHDTIMRKGGMKKDMRMQGDSHDTMMHKNGMNDDPMIAGRQDYETSHMPMTNAPVMMPMQMKDDNTMELKDNGRNAMSKDSSAAVPPKTTVDDSDINQDPISFAKNDMENKSKQRRNEGRTDAYWNMQVEQPTSNPSREGATSMPSRTSGMRGEKSQRSRSIGNDDGSAGAYATMVGNSPSLVDPSAPTYGHQQLNEGTTMKDEHYSMHSKGTNHGRKVSVGSENQDVDMTDAHMAPPISEEVGMGYHYHQGSVPRGHDEQEKSDADTHGKHKPGVFQRIKRTLSNKGEN